ncbi:unnamed protein product [Polarella glacialis]|uniref:EF-hand domain-containing protein n=1 Tax=Polarella glacialis TaxID=89957 RepID=A0A813F0R0_POLGL|nr:unnamed protein product [Polarella glacialis]
MGSAASTAGPDEKLRADISVKLHAAKKSRRENRGNRVVLQETLAAVGPDSAGTVSFKQFKQGAERLAIRVPDKQLKAAFAPFEVLAGAGRLSVGEFVEFVCGSEVPLARGRSSPSSSSTSPAPARSAPAPKGGRPSSSAAPRREIELNDSSEAGVRQAAARIADSLFDKEIDLRKAFKQWDKDGSGGLDQKEFGAALESLGFGAAPEAVEAVFKAFDLKGDGRISSWELMRGLYSLQSAAEATADEKDRRDRRGRKLDSALRKQDEALTVVGAGLGGGRLPEAVSWALAKGDVDALRTAVRAAEKAGLSPEDLKDARTKLRDLEEKAAARDELEDSVSSRPWDADRIRAAVTDAEAAGLDEQSLEAAQKALAHEEWREAVRQRLEDAVESRDPSALQEAIADGEGASLPEEELRPARKVLAEEERKARARAALHAAVAAKACGFGPDPRAQAGARALNARLDGMLEADGVEDDDQEKDEVEEFGASLVGGSSGSGRSDAPEQDDVAGVSSPAGADMAAPMHSNAAEVNQAK